MAERDIQIVASFINELSAHIAKFQENLSTAALEAKEAFDGLNDAQTNAADIVRKLTGESANLGTALDALKTAAEQAAIASQESTVKSGLLGEVIAKAGEIAQFHYKPSAVEEIYGAYYNTALLALDEFNKQVVNKMKAAGMNELEIKRATAELKMQYDAKERDFKLQTLSQSFGAAIELMENLYVATGSTSKKLFHVMKAFAIAQALVDTYGAFNRALNSLPYPFNLAAAATVLASGMARVVQIRATEPGGGSPSAGAGTAYHGVSSSAYPVSPVSATGETKQTQVVTINIYNPLATQNWQEIVEDNIIPALNGAANRNISVTVRQA
ncbi:MAG TPA: hypothetical protein VI728_02245 [Syntrophales bacterium]|nr:hypothetical protein [Syntrophales bacterium]